jgi:hypothetical protein
MNALLELPGDVLFVCNGTSVLRVVSMGTYHTRKLRLCSCLTPRSFSLPFPLSLFLRQCFPSFPFCILYAGSAMTIVWQTPSLSTLFLDGGVYVCSAVKEYVTSRELISRDTSCHWGRRPAAPKLQVGFFRSQAPGGVETPTIQPERSHITISITLKLLN